MVAGHCCTELTPPSAACFRSHFDAATAAFQWCAGLVSFMITSLPRRPTQVLRTADHSSRPDQLVATAAPDHRFTVARPGPRVRLMHGGPPSPFKHQPVGIIDDPLSCIHGVNTTSTFHRRLMTTPNLAASVVRPHYYQVAGVNHLLIQAAQCSCESPLPTNASRHRCTHSQSPQH